MAKKKSRRKNQLRDYRRQAAAQVSASTAQEATRESIDFGEEYRYVITDLRNMGILAALMFALLIVLALILG